MHMGSTIAGKIFFSRYEGYWFSFFFLISFAHGPSKISTRFWQEISALELKR